MKKTILCMLLVLLAALLVMPASAATTEHPHSGDHCLCAGSGADIYKHTCQAVSWEPLPTGTTDFGKLEGGNYYLTADVKVTGTTAINNDLTICLNGYNITATGGRCFGNTVESTLTITDCSYANGTWGGTVTGGNSIYGQIIYTYYKSTVNIYGGNFTGSSTARLAGLFCIAQDGFSEAAKTDAAYKAVMNIYNGNIYGGKAGKGGNLYAMHCAQINIYGGQIHDGTAQYIEWQQAKKDSNGDVVKDETTGETVMETKYQCAVGGNIHADSNSCINIYSGSIYGGTAAQSSKDIAYTGLGGNISADGTLNIYGGRIYDGYAEHNTTTKDSGTAWSQSTPGRGGNIYASHKKAVLNISGGYIWGGKANGIGGGNIWFENGTFNMSGGMIWGGIANADGDAKNSAGLTNAHQVCGGSVRVQNGTFNMTGGSIGIDEQGNPAGGTTLPVGSEVGNCYFYGTGYEINLSGGTIACGNTWLDENGKLTYGKSNKGGNIGGNASITVSGDMIIRDGYAAAVGGNWTIFNNNSCSITGGTISGGTAPRGGNIVIGGNDTDNDLLTVTGGIISGGTATTKEGGNIAIDHASKGVDITGGTITGGTAKTGYGNIYSIGILCFDSTTLITDGSPASVMIMTNGTYVSQYATLTEAMANVQDDQYLRLTGTVSNATVTDGMLIDLAGNDMTGVTIAGSPCFMDTTTDTYNGSNVGFLTLASGSTLASTYKTTAAQAGAIRRYLAIEENGSYSFHRYYMAITKMTLKPGTAGMGYKATFVGSDYVKERLSDTTAYGYRMWLTEDAKITRGYPASRFGGEQELTLRIDNFLNSSLTAEANEERAHMPVYACAYLRFADGTVVETAPVSYTFRDMLEKANSSYSSYTATQQNALKNLSLKFSKSMISWDISSIHHPFGSVWQSVDSETFNTVLKNNSNSLPSGSYYLTEDVDIGTRSIKIAAGRTVNICLNGFTLSSSKRMFNTYGNLSFCDCHADGEEGNVISSFTTDEADSDKEFTSIIYCYYDSVTNLYGGNLKNTGDLEFSGLIAVSHDGKDANASKPVGVFNMYGGTISGGNVRGSGGDVTLWNGGMFNLYGGTVYGGTAQQYGGAFNVTPSCTLNIYGGTVTGGTAAGGRGGNIYSAGNLNIYGGTVTGGTAPALTDESGATVIGTGLGGGIYAYSGNVNISGNTVIDGNTGSNLYINGATGISIEDLTADAKIGLSADVRGAISGDPTVASHLTCEREGFAFHNVNGKLVLADEDFDASAVNPSVSTFSVGYAMNNVAPTESGLTLSGYGNPNGRKTDGTINYEPYVTTIAITDKENNTILMITMDTQNAPENIMQYICSRISQTTGVPAGNIYLSATHTHNCPSLSIGDNGNGRYTALFVDQLVQSALDALADRAPATMQTGSFDTDGMNYSRHYYYFDENGEKVYFGDQFGLKPSTVKEFFRVRQGDETMHLLAFNREGKQPVLLANWRAHPHRSGGKTSYIVDADVIGATREYMHENTDYLFAYFQGAAGNMNTTSRISGETYKSGKIEEYGHELGRQITVGMKNLQTVETGLIQTKKIIYAANVDHSQDGKIEDAKALQTFYQNNPTEMDTLEEQITKAAEYGFTSVFHATRLIAKYNLPETKDIELNIFSIGDSIGFYTAPGELWDSFSEELEQESPFGTTFCIGYSNGNVAYIPYKLYDDTDENNYGYGSYEYYYCLFTQQETIMQMRAFYLENLQQQYDNASK